jgi:hypothetical protein
MAFALAKSEHPGIEPDELDAFVVDGSGDISGGAIATRQDFVTYAEQNEHVSTRMASALESPGDSGSEGFLKGLWRVPSQSGQLMKLCRGSRTEIQCNWWRITVDRIKG